ncbi:hypothetical protein [Micromonospora globispora]|nr:hypothetical protein [Micromonospora globispora]
MDDRIKQGKPRVAGRPLLAVGVGVLSAIAMGLFTYHVGIPSRSSFPTLGSHDFLIALALGLVAGGIAGWLTFRKGLKGWTDPDT